MTPVNIKAADKMLTIKWDDERITNIKLANLRINCPCAICSVDRESHGSKYIPIYSDEQLTISNIEVIGNYAIGISWKDNHNTGIYDYNHLIKLSS